MTGLWTRMLAVVVGSQIVLTGGCSDLTTVQAPNVTQPGDLANPGGALVRYNGAYADFSLGFVLQAGESGLISDELTSANGPSFPDDQRVLPEGLTPYPFSALSTARVNALLAAQALERYAPSPPSRVGEMFALIGYIETVFAENLCSGVPLSSIVGSQVVYGTPLTRDELLGQALADFDSATHYGIDSARVAGLALTGRGRALLDLARFSEAAAAVSSVPTNYVYQALFLGTQDHQNFIYANVAQGLDETVSNKEGINGLDFVSAQDPRVPTVVAGTGLDGVTQVQSFVPYSSATAPVIVASGIEARLIQAEAALQAGDAVGWIDTLNTLRTRVPGLAPLSDPGTTAQRVDLQFRERAFWLFLSGHRQGDMRRLIRQYGRGTESVFPTGPWVAGLLYGTDVTFPTGEQFNPNYTACLDRNP
jgi:hypothetical protein